MMSVKTPPRYLRVAHWLHMQQRFISAREAAVVFDTSVWSMGQDFSKIRRLPNIIEFEEMRVPSQGGLQYLLRVRYIYPYALDGQQQPHRRRGNGASYDIPLTWRDLLLRPWHQLVEMQQRDKKMISHHTDASASGHPPQIKNG